MELDVHLTREGDEPWGFEFVGGAECHVPLTVDKVQPSSPAQAAALQPGDVVARLGDRLAAELSHEAALAIVAESVASLSLGICRGLYDPVLDNFEPIYEPTERADSDLRSEPTEVYQDLSLDDPNILDPSITDPSLWDSGYATRPLTETRSLTASPFVPNTKPYRPFSTEPLEVPPLDDPIILNPNYKDTFNVNGNTKPAKALDSEEDDLLRLLPLDRNVEPKFKLPVSEKFDPDWDKKVRAMLERCADGGKRDSQQIQHELASYSNKSEISTEELHDMKATKQVTVQESVVENKIIKEETKFEVEEFNAQKIEQVALEVVEESIERAVSVTEDIKKEIEEERASMIRELKVDESETTEMNIDTEEHERKAKKVSVCKSEMTEAIHETEILEESTQKSEMTVTENEDIQEKLGQGEKFVEERRLSTKKEMEETTGIDSRRKKPSVFDKQEENTTIHEEKKHETEESISAGTVKRQSILFENDDEPNRKEVLRKVSHAEEMKSEHHTREFSSSGVCNETLKSEGKQKAYMIGLQTIPHIKGFVQSSYHFDLLLRTFFVHLTDVMVALSRFILTQPAQELESKAEKVVKDKLIKESVDKDDRFERKETMHRREDIKDNEVIVKEKKVQEKDMRQETKVVQAKQDIKTAKVETQERKEFKKETHKMQQIKQDVMKSEQVKSKDLFSKQEIQVESEEVETRKKSGAEMAQRTQRKSRDLTQKMDAVITEFETKTGIEDRLEVIEQSGRRSRSRSHIEEEVMRESDPLEWLDKVDSRRASQERTDITVNKEFSSYSESKETKKSETKHESRTTKVKPGKQMYVAIVESHVYTNKDAILEEQVAEISETASVESSEEINAALESFEAIATENVAISNMVQTEEKQQALEVITNALQEVVQEKQEILEAVSDFTSQITETKEAHVETKLNKQEAVTKQEILTTVAAETTETVDESKIESFKAKEVISKQAVVSSEDNYKAAAESTTAIILEASKEETANVKVEEHQAVSKIESLAIAVAESTDVVVDDSKVETFESQQLESTKASVKSEETFKTATVGVSEVTFEITEDKHSEKAKTSEVTIKEEAQHLAVACIIETKTELCKEPKKPAEDEYASLKIVKEQIIDADESVEISSESELNVKQSLEVDISSSHQSISQSRYQSISQESSTIQETSSSVQATSSSIQETSISTESQKSAKSLHINTNLAQTLNRQTSDQSDENNNTPTPTTVPPTPLTDEYVFKLEIPLPKNQGTVIIEDSPDREDPHIVKKGLVPYIETTIEEQIIYDPPLPTPPEDKVTSPVYTKPGLKGGAAPLFKKEYIREIERKSSLLASAIDETIKSIEEYKEEVGIDTGSDVTIQLSNTKAREEAMTNGVANGHEHKSEQIVNGSTQEQSKESSKMNGTDVDSARENDALPGFKPVIFNPEEYQAKLYEEVTRAPEPAAEHRPYVSATGEPLGTVRGIVDGLDDAIVDEELAKELGKPGLTEDKIAELISGESEMLREAHVMGLTRVLTSHMTRPDDSVDFNKIKPLYESLKNSEVLKALNEEIKRESEKKKKDEKKWTTFLQKPKRPVPRAKFGCTGYTEAEEIDTNEPYKVKIVKQPKPKVAPDYKPEDFETGPLPWEQRALTEPVPSPVPPEEPILIPEEAEFFEAVDPLPEGEVPDLEDTGIPLPPTPPPELPTELPPEPQAPPDLPETEPEPQPEVQVEASSMADMDQNAMAEQLVNTVKGMVDPNASLEQQLCQMRSQLAALAQLPAVIQHSLEMLTHQLSTMSRQETHQTSYEMKMKEENHQEIHESSMAVQQYEEQVTQNGQEAAQNYQVVQNGDAGTQNEESTVTIEEVQETPMMTAEEAAALKREQDAMIEEQRRSEKEKKARQESTHIDHQSRQVKQRAPRVGKPRPAFGPLAPEDRPLVLPGGRRWRGPKDAYNEQFIAETIQAQSEIIQGKVMGYESDRLPYDDRINFMKYEKPPVSLDHLQNSATYKLVHNIEEAPLKRTDLLTPVVAEADYRERCRSATPVMQANGRM